MMSQLAVVQRILGILLMLFSTSMLIPAGVALIYGNGALNAFLIGFAVTLISGFLVWAPARRAQNELKLRDGFLVVVLFWIVLSLFGAVPLLLAQHPDLSVTDAVFEAVSGLTTSGATILTAINDLPHAILFWRQLLHWMGGMGIIVLAVAVMPMLGVGGMQLYKAEIPGPMKDAKLTPRIRETAKALWLVYLALTLVCIGLMWLAGMPLFDAISHGFSAIATGGFSIYNESIGHYDSRAIELVTMLCILIGSINFGLHFTAWRSNNPLVYLRDPESRTFLGMVVVVSLFVSATLLLTGFYTDIGHALITGAFMIVSIGTTTGLVIDDYSTWPTFLPMFILFGGFIGGCAGSTTGGMKVVRFMLLSKQGLREITRLIHPNARIPVKLGTRVVPDHVIQAVWGFFAVYVTIFALMFLLLLANGVDELTAFSAVAACINNMGVGLGNVSSSFAGLPDFSKWVLSLAMIMGRLEIFTLLVVFTPAFWKR